MRLTTSVRIAALRVPLVSNAVLVVLKLAMFFVSGSVSILSEAVHSGADLVVTLAQVYSVKLAARPADRDHAYGHGKFENLGAAIEALVILATAAVVIGEAIARLHTPLPIAPLHLDLGIGLMFASAVVNAFVSARLEKTAKREHSPALHAEAAQLRADVITASGVGGGLVAIHITGIGLIDPIVSLLVAGLIVKAAYDVTVRAFVDLTDGRLPPEQESLIHDIIRGHADIFVGYHKLRTRRAGGNEFVDFHLQMPGGLALKAAHDLSDVIVEDIKKAMPRANVLIHLEPDE